MRDLDEDSYTNGDNSQAKSSHRDKSSIIEIDLQRRGGPAGKGTNQNIVTMSQKWKKGLASEMSSDSNNIGNASNLWHRKRSVC
jgi:hypothetical protein